MRRALLVAVVGLAGLAGCGDNRSVNEVDARPQFDGNPTPDAPPVNDFTAFVHQQILTNTLDTADPVPYAVFATLPDNDRDDNAFQAYADLF